MFALSHTVAKPLKKKTGEVRGYQIMAEKNNKTTLLLNEEASLCSFTVPVAFSVRHIVKLYSMCCQNKV